MKKEKAFDCVEMKDEIQRKLLARWRGMSDEEVIQDIRKDLDESKSPMAAWWRSVEKRQVVTPGTLAASH